MRYTIDLIESTCGLKFEIRTDRAANLESHFKALDGPGGVLARHWLPSTPSQCHEQRRGEWDSRENPTQQALDVVTIHEVLHGLGLGHHTGEPSIMNPSLNLSMHGRMDRWTRSELVLRYDEPQDDPDPPEPPLPPPDQFDFRGFVRTLAKTALEFVGD